MNICSVLPKAASSQDERGMATAEYTVGTLGAVCIGLVVYKLGILDQDNPWLDSLRDILQKALGWRSIVPDFIPGLGLRP